MQNNVYTKRKINYSFTYKPALQPKHRLFQMQKRRYRRTDIQTDRETDRRTDRQTDRFLQAELFYLGPFVLAKLDYYDLFFTSVSWHIV